MHRNRKLLLAAAAASMMGSTALAVDQFKISLGVREATGAVGMPIGANGGTAGPIEWVNKDGPTLNIDGTWQQFTYNFGTDPVTAFTGNGTLDQAQTVLEHIRILNSGQVGDIIKVWIDDVVNTPSGQSPTILTDFEPPTVDPAAPNGTVLFRNPRFSGSTNGNLTTAADLSVIDSTIAHGGTQSLRLEFQFKSNNAAEWIRLTTFNMAQFPNPVIENSPGSTFSFWMRSEVVEPATHWNVATGGGNWSDPANWVLDTGVVSVPGTTFNVSDVANFLSVATAPVTVTVDTPITLNTLRIKNANASYTFNTTDPNSNTILLSGPVQFTANVNAEAGSHTINVPLQFDLRASVFNVGSATGSLVITQDINFDFLATGTGVAFQKLGPGLLEVNNLRSGAATVSGGTVKMRPNGGDPGASKVPSLAIAGTPSPTATLDVNNNAFIVDYDDAGSSPLATLTGYVQSGYAGGSWNGTGINSSAAASTAGHSVGIIEASDIGSPTTYAGQTLTGNAVLIRYTRTGDANLDGTTNIGDFSLLASSFNTAGRWYNGDFNYDGSVNIGDFSLLASQFNQVAGDAPRGAVPEPAALGLLGIGLVGAIRRRRA